MPHLVRSCAALGLVSLLALAGGTQRGAVAAEPWALGAVVSESGLASSLGRPAADSIQLAVDEINAAGGVAGRRLAVTILDDESNPTTAIDDVRRLTQQKVVAILGPSITQTSLAVIPLATEGQIPLLSLASNAQVIEPVGERKWIFKMPITDIHTAEIMQTYLKRAKLLKIAFIYRNDDYGKSGLEHFEEAAKGSPLTIVDREPIAANATDATTQLTHVKASNPDVVVAWTTLPSTGVLMRGYRELALPYPLYYSDGSATGLFLKQVGDIANGVHISSPKINVVDQLPERDPQQRVLRRYIDSFERSFPKDAPANIFGGFGYDAVYIVAAALQRAGTADGEKLRAALEGVRYTGVSGAFRLSPTDHNGLSLDSQVMTRIQSGKFVIEK